MTLLKFLNVLYETHKPFIKKCLQVSKYFRDPLYIQQKKLQKNLELS